MKNYVIAKKDLKMNGNWIYALSIEGREAFKNGNKSQKINILTKLLLNGNITMPKLIEISK